MLLGLQIRIGSGSGMLLGLQIRAQLQFIAVTGDVTVVFRVEVIVTVL